MGEESLGVLQPQDDPLDECLDAHRAPFLRHRHQRFRVPWTHERGNRGPVPVEEGRAVVLSGLE